MTLSVAKDEFTPKSFLCHFGIKHSDLGDYK